MTEEAIAKSLKGSPMKTLQGSVSLPVVQDYVKMLENGSSSPGIKVAGDVIIDGNHRYVAGRVFGVEPLQDPGTMSPSQVSNVRPIQEIGISLIDWRIHK